MEHFWSNLTDFWPNLAKNGPKSEKIKFKKRGPQNTQRLPFSQIQMCNTPKNGQFYRNFENFGVGNSGDLGYKRHRGIFSKLEGAHFLQNKKLSTIVIKRGSKKKKMKKSSGHPLFSKNGHFWPKMVNFDQKGGKKIANNKI